MLLLTEINALKRKEYKGRWGSSEATGGVYFWLTHMLFRQPDPKGQLWQTWSDTVDVLRNCLSPEIPPTYTLIRTTLPHKDKCVVMLLTLSSPWQNELCSSCQEDTQHHRAPDGYQEATGCKMWKSTVLRGAESQKKMSIHFYPPDMEI